MISSQIKFGAANAIPDSDGLFPVNVFSPAADNYINKLKVSLNYQGESEVYLRVKVLKEWKLEQKVDGLTEIAALSNSPLTAYDVLSGWYDKRKYDGYFYCKTPPDAGTAMNIPLITGASNYWRDPEYMPQVNDYPKLIMRMCVIAEAVQTNC